MHFLSLPATQETRINSNERRTLPRIEEKEKERERKTPSRSRLRSERKKRLEEERGASDLPTANDTEWSVAGPRRRRRRLRSTKSTKANSQVSQQQMRGGTRGGKNEQRPPRIRPPRSAAVAVRIPDGKISYADAMKKARREVDNMDLGDTRIRRDVTGGLLIQIPGKEGKIKARQLQNKLQKVLGRDVRVTILSKRAEIRVIRFDDSVTEEEILDRMASVGGCSKNDIKIGPIRLLYSGLCAVWVQCPVDAIQSIVRAGRVRLGWTSARVILLLPRKLQCFKCLELEHVKATCPSTEDRSSLCYRCGEAGHRASTCANKVRCPICASRGQESGHRIGAIRCSAKRVVGIPIRRRQRSHDDSGKDDRGAVANTLEAQEGRENGSSPAQREPFSRCAGSCSAVGK